MYGITSIYLNYRFLAGGARLPGHCIHKNFTVSCAYLGTCLEWDSILLLSLLVSAMTTRLTAASSVAKYNSLAMTLSETQPVRVSDYWHGETNLTKDFYYERRQEDGGKIQPTISLSRNSRNEIWILAELPSVFAPRILRKSGFWESSQREVRHELQIEFGEQIEPARRRILEIYASVR